MTFTLDNTAGGGSLDIGDVQHESVSVVSIILNFDAAVDDFTKSGSSGTSDTYLTKVFKPQCRITVTGIKKCADAAAARSFKDSLLAFSGVADSNTTFRYTGVLDTAFDGLLEDVTVDLGIGNFLVGYSFTMLEGTLT